MTTGSTQSARLLRVERPYGITNLRDGTGVARVVDFVVHEGWLQ